MAISTQSTCNQVLAVVDVRCWALIPCSPPLPHPLSSWPRCTCKPSYKQMLINMGQVVIVSPSLSLSPPVSSLSPSPHSGDGWSPILLSCPPPPSHPHAPTLQAVARSNGAVIGGIGGCSEHGGVCLAICSCHAW
jgi:hypothetical protein